MTTTYGPDRMFRAGMRAVIHDVDDYVTGNIDDQGHIRADTLRAYLLACLITADGFEDTLADLELVDGEG